MSTPSDLKDAPAANDSEDEFYDSEADGGAGAVAAAAAPPPVASDDVFVEFADHEKNPATAQEKKAAGNALFAAQDYAAALQSYTAAVAFSSRDTPDVAIFLANRAACFLKLDKLDECERDCTAALAVQPTYVKGLLRRATARERLDRLEDALEDYKQALALDGKCAEARAAVARLPGAIDAQREKLKTEMFGKLKELGNMCLNPFGLSTDNFKLVQDPATGGYSMSFSQK